MTDYELMDILGKAFVDGEVETLSKYLSEDCLYTSEYADVTVKSCEKITKRIKKVYDNTRESGGYYYQIVTLNSLLRHEEDTDTDISPECHINKYAIRLSQYKADYLVAIVSVTIDDKNEKINSISLSRDSQKYNTFFYLEEIKDESPDDLPSSVKSYSQEDIWRRDMQREFSGQHLDDQPKPVENNLYIWRKADEFTQSWLENHEYRVHKTQVFDDCIGYRCGRRGLAYTVYMFAYGTHKTTQVSGKYCQKLESLEFSQDSTVLVLWLNVKKIQAGSEYEYKIYDYTGTNENRPDLWSVDRIDEMPILLYFPNMELIKTTFRFMYAFNHDSLDVYDCLINSDYNKLELQFHGITSPYIADDNPLIVLQKIHQLYGEMKIGYSRYDDIIYCREPYIDGFGYFGYSMNNNSTRITKINVKPFSRPIEYIKTDEREYDNWYNGYPSIVSAEPLSPVSSERFALKILFSNHVCKKYILPISRQDEGLERVHYQGFDFSDDIWITAKVVDCTDAEIKGYSYRKSSIIFENGFILSGYLCYQDGEDYSEPVLCHKKIFEDDQFKVERLWKWDVESMYAEKSTGMLGIVLSGIARNYEGKTTFASCDGKRLCSITFDFMSSFEEGLIRVAKYNCGYGYMNEKLQFVIPMQYELAKDFVNGKAKVKKNGEWYYIDKTGQVISKIPSDTDSKYQDIADFSEGLCRVSTLKLGMMDLAYYSDYSDIAGIWGYINEAGEEVIPPQYIYAQDFSNGIALVCKGKWTIDPKWDDQYNKGKYGSDEELWGAIDKEGHEVIPCKFDEIKYFEGTGEYYIAHTGGWTDGRWGVIDKLGNWVADPVFKNIGYDYCDGLMTFSYNDEWDDDALWGVYDIKQRQIVFEPQFFDVDFTSNGLLKVEVYDSVLDRRIEKLIDRNGKEQFRSVYSSIFTWTTPYEVIIRDNNGNRNGLIDTDGKIIVPCKHETPWGGISEDQKLMIIEEDEKKGLMDFEENVIIPTIYLDLYGLNNPLLTFRVGEKNSFMEGLISKTGQVIIPAIYKNLHWCKDNYIICETGDHCEMMRLIIKNKIDY